MSEEFKIEHILEEFERAADGEVTAKDAAAYLEFHFKKSAAALIEVREAWKKMHECYVYLTPREKTVAMRKFEKILMKVNKEE